VPVPEAFPLEEEFEEFSHTFIRASDGEAAEEGRWATGPAPDGRDFRSALIQATGDEQDLAPGDPRLYGTNPLQETKGLVEKAKDALS
jgi:Mn-containing catalase